MFVIVVLNGVLMSVVLASSSLPHSLPLFTNDGYAVAYIP